MTKRISLERLGLLVQQSREIDDSCDPQYSFEEFTERARQVLPRRSAEDRFPAVLLGIWLGDRGDGWMSETDELLANLEEMLPGRYDEFVKSDPWNHPRLSHSEVRLLVAHANPNLQDKIPAKIKALLIWLRQRGMSAQFYAKAVPCAVATLTRRSKPSAPEGCHLWDKIYRRELDDKRAQATARREALHTPTDGAIWKNMRTGEYEAVDANSNDDDE